MYLLWISLQNFEGVLQGVGNISQSFSSLSDSSWLSKGSCEPLVVVHLVVKLKLKDFLTLFHEEISNGFWNGVFHISQHNLEISVNSLSHL